MAPARFELSAAAGRDLAGILEYSAAQFGLAQALRYEALLRHALEAVAANPGIARPYALRAQVTLRQFPAGRHVIFLQEREHDVLVVRILHERMDHKRHLPGE